MLSGPVMMFRKVLKWVTLDYFHSSSWPVLMRVSMAVKCGWAKPCGREVLLSEVPFLARLNAMGGVEAMRPMNSAYFRLVKLIRHLALDKDVCARMWCLNVLSLHCEGLESVRFLSAAQLHVNARACAVACTKYWVTNGKTLRLLELWHGLEVWDPIALGMMGISFPKLETVTIHLCNGDTSYWMPDMATFQATFSSHLRESAYFFILRQLSLVELCVDCKA